MEELCSYGFGEHAAPFQEPVRHVVFDMYQQVWPRRVARFPVVIVDIDEASIAALGQWPWPRTRLARLLEATHQLGALAVGLDMIMPEVDRLSPSEFIALGLTHYWQGDIAGCCEAEAVDENRIRCST